MDKDLTQDCKVHMHDFEGMFWDVNPLLARLIKSKSTHIMYKPIIINYAKIEDNFLGRLSPETYIRNILNHKGSSYMLTPNTFLEEGMIIEGTIKLDRNSHYVFWVNGIIGDAYLEVVVNSTHVNVELQVMDNDIVCFTLEDGYTHDIIYVDNYLAKTSYGYVLNKNTEYLWELLFTSFLKIMCSASNDSELTPQDMINNFNGVKRLVNKILSELPLDPIEVSNICLLKSELNSIDTNIMVIDEVLYMHASILMTAMIQLLASSVEKYLFGLLESSKL